jgi:hypothetical protein
MRMTFTALPITSPSAFRLLVQSASLSLPELHQEILKLFAPVAQMAQPNLGSPHRVYPKGMNEVSFFKVRDLPVIISDSFAPLPPEVFYRDRHYRLPSARAGASLRICLAKEWE